MKTTLTKIFLIFFPLFFLTGCSGNDSIDNSNLTTYDLSIPGVKKDYKFLFLTDTHVINESSDSDEQTKNYEKERLAVFQNQENAFAPISLMKWSEYANKENFDALLLGGDIIDSPSVSNIDYLNSSLASFDTPYLYTLGNHDWTYPWEYMTEEGKNKYLPAFLPSMDNNTAFHCMELEDLILVAIDNSSNQINPEALAPYREILSKGKPVIVLLHVPLYTESLLAKTKEAWGNPVVLSGGIHGGIYPDSVSTEFINLTLSKDSPVAAVIAGHVHLDDRSVILGEKEIPQITGDAGYKGKGTIIRITG